MRAHNTLHTVFCIQKDTDAGIHIQKVLKRQHDLHEHGPQFRRGAQDPRYFVKTGQGNRRTRLRDIDRTGHGTLTFFS
ncbi:hypothetical protein GCM10027407_10920 [Acetobacter peroxydans]